MPDIIEEYISEGEKEILEIQKKERAAFLLKINSLMAHSNFEDFISFLLDITNFNGNTYGNDTYSTEYFTARRSVFIEILGVLEAADPSFYPRLLLKRIKEVKDV